MVIVTVPGGQEGLSAVEGAAQGYYVKRAVALAGESFTATGSASPCSKDIFSIEKQEKMNNWLIPADHVFVCGDNRQGSINSRIWGPLPLRNVRGIVMRKLAPSSASLPAHATIPYLPAVKASQEFHTLLSEIESRRDG